MYAERLGATNKKQSAIGSLLYHTVYFSLGDYLNAFQIYCECGSYEESIMCFKKLTDIDTCVQEKLLRVLLSICCTKSDALIRNGHYLKASQVAEIYFDIEESIDILIEGRLWLQAFDLTTEKAEKFNRFKIELFERSDYFLQFFENQTQQISLKKARLLKVREEKAKRIFASNFGFESETSSVTSFSSTGSESVLITGSTTTSTKMRKSKKKQNSKYYRLKPDGPYEDFALMNEFFKLFEGSNKHISEAEDISNVLNMLGEWQRSRKLCSKMNTFKEFMSQTFHQIWTPNQHLGPFSTCQMYEDFILEEGTIDSNHHIRFLDLPILSLPDYETFKINHDLI
ncbi:Elongator complex protein 1 [Thelohanellus kitauei]|uniref:Elongator complex protein 1 n=1 Tax=Thelohanellus kitauei TaxID=669202 RepID=A0A0C2JUU6_THEKT|nr:Elongator complex protein 1 [Thelohanellus kitauei]